jgi:hypothetical protein
MDSLTSEGSPHVVDDSDESGWPDADCSWEVVVLVRQVMVIGGSRNSEYASEMACPMMQAITVSVTSGRWLPCCSKLPTGRTAMSNARTPASGDVIGVNNSIVALQLDGGRELS